MTGTDGGCGPGAGGWIRGSGVSGGGSGCGSVTAGADCSRGWHGGVMFHICMSISYWHSGTDCAIFKCLCICFHSNIFAKMSIEKGLSICTSIRSMDTQKHGQLVWCKPGWPKNS